jgi:nitrite reductase/ring-hydroxylating ferredoxin subunit
MTDDGCLRCPRHAALYDVGTGVMVQGPQRVFKPLASAVTTGARSLKTFPVNACDGMFWLVG